MHTATTHGCGVRCLLTLGFDAAVTMPVTMTSWLTRSACAHVTQAPQRKRGL